MKTLNMHVLPVLFVILLSSCTFNASLKNLETELGKGDQSSSPTVDLQKIFVDVTSITLTEGSVAIINVAVNPVQTTDTVINLNLSTSGGSYIRFNPIPSQIIIPAGSTSKSVVLNTIDDSLIQDQEIWSFSIASPNPELHADPGILNVTLNDNDGGVVPGAPVVAGAKLLKELNPYPAAVNKIAFGGKVFYVGSDATNGAELWVTDGTPAGTHLVKDIEPGTGSSTPTNFFNPPASPYLFFGATTQSEGYELWVSDGTEQGTHIITKGFEPGAASANPNVLLAHDNKIYYTAITTADGREIYVSDGTNAGTKMLLETNSGNAGTSEVSFIANGNDIYFSIYGLPAYEAAIYKTDGTPSGTVLLVDKDSSGNPINDGLPLYAFSNGYLFYDFYDWSAGYELAASGLTNATTGLLKDIAPGWTSSYAAASSYTLGGKTVVFYTYDSSSTQGTGYFLTDGTSAGTTKVTQSIFVGSALGMIGTKLIFRGCVGNYDCELYATQGVNNDAVLLKDIYTGTTSGNANSGSPTRVAQIGNKIFFTATTAAEGTELWVTDGTSAGTFLLKDIYPGTGLSSPSNYIVVGTRLIFTARNPTYGDEIWISDGTTAGTVIYKDLVPGVSSSGPKNLVMLDSNTLFFTAYNSLSGFANVFTTNTSNYNVSGIAHALVESLNTDTKNFVEYNGLVYFDARDSSLGAPLWVTNGTPSGTAKIKDIYPMAGCTDINYMTTYNGSIFFTASTEAGGLEVQISNGTTAGTTTIDLNATSTSSSPSSFIKTDTGKMFFTANHDPTNYGSELYATDGTVVGTGMVKDLNPGATGSLAQNITAIPGTNKVILYSFQLKNFWVSDGTNAGTTTVSGLSSIQGLNYPPVVNSGGAFINYSESGTNKGRIYYYDKTTGVATHINTSYSTDVVSGIAPFVNPTSGLLYYITLNTSGTVMNLWKSDGTVAGTSMVKNIPFTGNNHSMLFIGHIGNKSLFQYGNNTTSPYVRQLWVTDGTAAGTSIIDDSTNTPMVNYTVGYNYNGYLYFTRYHATAGAELWKTDGTSANTTMVKDINPGTATSAFNPLAVYNGKLYFSANDGVNGVELWRTDGTLLGTELVTDINPGGGGSSPAYAKVIGGKLYFVAYKVLSGSEVWVYSE